MPLILSPFLIRFPPLLSITFPPLWFSFHTFPFLFSHFSIPDFHPHPPLSLHFSHPSMPFLFLMNFGSPQFLFSFHRLTLSPCSISLLPSYSYSSHYKNYIKSHSLIQNHTEPNPLLFKQAMRVECDAVRPLTRRWLGEKGRRRGLGESYQVCGPVKWYFSDIVLWCSVVVMWWLTVVVMFTQWSPTLEHWCESS